MVGIEMAGMPLPDHVRAVLDEHLRWNPVIDRLFAELEGEVACPFCGSSKVGVAWSVFNQDPRTASFDIGCGSCGKRMHAAILLPDHVPDVYRRAGL